MAKGKIDDRSEHFFDKRVSKMSEKEQFLRLEKLGSFKTYEVSS
jgi:hypothetical protein